MGKKRGCQQMTPPPAAALDLAEFLVDLLLQQANLPFVQHPRPVLVDHLEHLRHLLPDIPAVLLDNTQTHHRLAKQRRAQQQLLPHPCARAAPSRRGAGAKQSRGSSARGA